MTAIRLARSTVLADQAVRSTRSRVVQVGASTDTAPATSAMAGMGAAIPVIALGAVGAVFGGTLWGLYGLLGGGLAGGAAGYAVTRLAGSKAAEEVAKEDAGSDVAPTLDKVIPVPTTPINPADFGAPAMPKFVPPAVPTAFPEVVFPEAPTFFPTPSLWFPVSVVNSRERVGEHRDIAKGNTITFIAQRGYRDEKDTNDEIKLAAKIVISRAALTDRDPAYGVEVTGLVKEHNVDPTVERPSIGQRMVVAPDQVLSVELA